MGFFEFLGSLEFDRTFWYVLMSIGGIIMFVVFSCAILTRQKIPLSLLPIEQALKKEPLQFPIVIVLEMDERGVVIITNPLLFELVKRGHSMDEALSIMSREVKKRNSELSGQL